MIVCLLSMAKIDTEQDNKMKIYEIGYLLVPIIAEENVAAEVENIKSLLAKHEGAQITEDFPKLRPLAYNMVKAIGPERSKYDKAYFGWIKFEMMAGNVPLLKTDLDKNDHILRFMLIATVRENTMMTQKLVFRPAGEGEVAKEEGVEPAKVSEEELDKTIENLVVE